MKRRIGVSAMLVLALALISGTQNGAQALLTTYFGDQPGFSAQGTIYQFETFSGFCGDAFCYTGDPYTTSGITYVSTQNLIFNPGFSYGNSVPVFINNYWTPLDGTIDNTGYDMFGFSLGSLGQTSPMTLNITTNFGFYSYPSLIVPNVNVGLVFNGFVASSGEYFTGFTLSSDLGSSQYAPAITDVSLGITGATNIPEPSSLLLLGAGLVGLAAWWRKQAA